MGGILSGRHPQRCLVESSFTLDMSNLRREGTIAPGVHHWRTVTWKRSETGEVCGTITCEVNTIEPDDSFLRLTYSVNGDAQDYRVRLSVTPCRFGGVRWWFHCPHTGRRVSKLYLPPGARRFLSRFAYRLAYRSERGGPMDRSHWRQGRIYSRLGAEYRVFEQPPPRRPKGMHKRTYARLLRKLGAAQGYHECIFDAGAARLLAKLDCLPGVRSERLD